MLELIVKQGEWSLFSDTQHRELLAGLDDLNGLIIEFGELPVTLKDNHRSVVKRGGLLGKDVIVKRPIDKNRRLWARLSSLFTKAEALATVENLAKLTHAGVQSVAPLFALERRAQGMVVDSWVCYEYRAGEPCDASSINAIIEFLHHMHSQGFRHGDPTWNNFLRDQNGVLFTIDTKAKACTNAYHATVDFELLKRANKLKGVDIAELASLDKSSLGYWLAFFYMSLKSGRSALKDRLKKNRPKNH